VPFVPNQPDRIRFELPDVAHTFRRGHRVMVQVQSSWFPLTDRNPQTFTDIPKARPEDFVAATQRRVFAALTRPDRRMRQHAHVRDRAGGRATTAA
jgi:uncharacterized protein